MVFHFKWAIISQSILRFSLNHFIYDICSFNWPSFRNITFFYLYLFTQNMISYFFSRFTYIRSSAKHAFEGHHAYSEIIYRCRMIEPAHNLWRHISWRTWSILGIFGSPNSCYTKISYSNITIIIDNKIFWLNITMNNIFFMAIFKTSNKASYEKS